jgi:flagellar protein FlgJ
MALPAATTASALDFQGFAALRQLSRDRREEGAVQVARQFEALVLQMMVRSMRQALPGDPLLSSASSKVYRDLFDQQLALRLSESQSVGVSDVLVAQLRRSGALGKEAADAAAPAAGLRRGLLPSVSGRPGEGADPPPSDAVPASRTEEGNPFGRHQEFVQAVRPHAVRAARELGVAPEILIAQAALESGWGRSTLRREDGSNGFNLFGIKATPSWKGDHVSVPTLEYEGGVAVRRQAAFRAYGSYAESFQDYVALVRDNPRYARALERAADPQAYMRELQAAGYATDPAYAEKVIRIWESQLGGLTVARR